MKRIINFHRAYLPTVILSSVLIITGIAGYIIKGGFNLGVDFQAGLMQEIQLAPTAFELTYSGKGVASLSFETTKLEIVLSGADVENATHSFGFSAYPTVGALADALLGVEGVSVKLVAGRDVSSSILIQSAQGNPQLGSTPYALHYLLPNAEQVTIETVRNAVSSVGQVSVQVLGKPSERKFMVRVEDPGTIDGFAKVVTENMTAALASAFGSGEVAIISTNYVGSRFSKNLTDQAVMLLGLTLFLILVYAAFRFKFQYAVGAILAIMHDGLIMVAFIVWTRMEFNTTTIAAILTILGYSINDTIVIFDRIRESLRLYPEASLRDNMNRAITETLGRTFITTLTTMLAVISLFVFTTGSMKDFALALLVGMTSGVYSTIFIASSFVYAWDVFSKKRSSKARKIPAASAQKA